MPGVTTIARNPVDKLTWRLLGGASDSYTSNWGGYGDSPIRDDFSRLYFIERGYAVIRRDQQRQTLTPGKLYLIPAGVAAYYSSPEGMHLTWLHFNVHAMPGLDILEHGSPLFSVPAQEDTATAFAHMLENMAAGTPAGLSRAISIASRLVAPFLKTDWKDILPNKESSDRVYPVIEHIHSNLSSSLTLSDLAGIAGLHPVYLSRIFKRATGSSPAKYVALTRMNHAADQLRLTSKRVGEIGSECGYDDLYHFSRAFKQYIGVAPRVYRQARAKG